MAGAEVVTRMENVRARKALGVQIVQVVPKDGSAQTARNSAIQRKLALATAYVILQAIAFVMVIMRVVIALAVRLTLLGKLATFSVILL